MIQKDVIIVGAGVAGLWMSKILGKKGIDFVTLEQNSSVGKYGNRIINKDVFKSIGLADTDILYDIDELRFISPSGLMLTKKTNGSRGYAINIAAIENRIYSEIDAETVLFRKHVKNVNFELGIVEYNGGMVRSKLIIIASGMIQDTFRTTLNLEKPRTVFCYTNEIEGSDKITTLLDNKLAHGFYGWAMPLGENKVEIGFGTDRYEELKNIDLRERMLSFPYLDKFRKNNKIRELGGFIPISMSSIISGRNWVLVGDASGGEPMMGGSIHKSLDEAEIACKVIEEFLDGKISTLEHYTRLWKEKLGEDMKTQEKLRELIDRSTNADLDNLFKKVGGREIKGEGLINDVFRNIILNLKSSSKV